MIDFRYHLISLIAVFLALGLGILMGSVVLSEKYVKRLENRVERFGNALDTSRQQVSDLNDRVNALQEFSLEAEPRLVDGALKGQEVVAFEVDGTEEDVLGALAGTIEVAGGRLVSTISLTERFSLVDQPERDQLALIIGSASNLPGELRQETAALLGLRAAAAAGARVDGGRDGGARQKLEALLDQLQEAEFVDITTAEQTPVPAGASFVIAGGAADEPVGGPVGLSLNLAASLSAREAAAIVIEPTDSSWDLVAAVRDEAAAAGVSTVDHAETVPGRVATVLGLQMAIDGLTGHYGTEDGASAIVPPPTPPA